MPFPIESLSLSLSLRPSMPIPPHPLRYRQAPRILYYAIGLASPVADR